MKHDSYDNNGRIPQKDGVEEISVGIYTAGIPRLRHIAEGLTLLENMLIGKDFHWQRQLEALLPGRIEIKDGMLINHLPVEKYLECVVGSEMNPAAPPEFLKAHAIISRSWAVGKILGCHPEGDDGKYDTLSTLIGWDDTSAHIGFHVCSDDHCQRYQGVQPVSPEALEAIRSTQGIVLRDDSGKIVDARFSKCCGGKTEMFSTCWQDVDMSCLKSFDDPWCDLSNLPSARREDVLNSILKDYDLSTGGGYRWTATVSKESVRQNLLNKFGRDIGEIVSLRALERGPSGRISLLHIKGSGGSLDLGKELWIRRLLSSTHLYSSAFDIEDKGSYLKLTGRGWGHGVGLCQTGAARMALEGADAADILRFYYPGSHLS